MLEVEQKVAVTVMEIVSNSETKNVSVVGWAVAVTVFVLLPERWGVRVRVVVSNWTVVRVVSVLITGRPTVWMMVEVVVTVIVGIGG
jgi:hypothetical protein